MIENDRYLTPVAIFWLVVGILLLVFAGILLFTDSITMEQKDLDACQTAVLGLLALGLAWRR